MTSDKNSTQNINAQRLSIYIDLHYYPLRTCTDEFRQSFFSQFDPERSDEFNRLTAYFNVVGEEKVKVLRENGLQL
ncbi:hypothetical protein [Parvularcula sp. IMCC14364]|uniref:hypothetical protein n=1 Tax=Parvularcula sp. IMCC14364 TaxID=3067902 RepID=UPI002741FA07|nr:hypothetical protein [Parvularcula sp. IMCC14364]